MRFLVSDVAKRADIYHKIPEVRKIIDAMNRACNMTQNLFIKIIKDSQVKV